METVIGLEVHAQLLTRSKMFCGCPTTFGALPNSQTCPVCQGMPGLLPVVTRRAVEFGIRAALAFDCRVNAACRFARKHYYYPDMPKNYQITQYEEPLAEDGHLEIEVDGASRTIGIQRLHLEEDVGKLLHEGTLETAQASLVDYNRSGVPLMETVSKPDIRSPEEAAAYLKAFRAVLVFLGVSNGHMEEGSLSCDASGVSASSRSTACRRTMRRSSPRAARSPSTSRPRCASSRSRRWSPTGSCPSCCVCCRPTTSRRSETSR